MHGSRLALIGVALHLAACSQDTVDTWSIDRGVAVQEEETVNLPPLTPIAPPPAQPIPESCPPGYTLEDYSTRFEVPPNGYVGPQSLGKQYDIALLPVGPSIFEHADVVQHNSNINQSNFVQETSLLSSMFRAQAVGLNFKLNLGIGLGKDNKGENPQAPWELFANGSRSTQNVSRLVYNSTFIEKQTLFISTGSSTVANRQYVPGAFAVLIGLRMGYSHEFTITAESDSFDHRVQSAISSGCSERPSTDAAGGPTGDVCDALLGASFGDVNQSGNYEATVRSYGLVPSTTQVPIINSSNALQEFFRLDARPAVISAIFQALSGVCHPEDITLDFLDSEQFNMRVGKITVVETHNDGILGSQKDDRWVMNMNCTLNGQTVPLRGIGPAGPDGNDNREYAAEIARFNDDVKSGQSRAPHQNSQSLLALPGQRLSCDVGGTAFWTGSLGKGKSAPLKTTFFELEFTEDGLQRVSGSIDAGTTSEGGFTTFKVKSPGGDGSYEFDLVFEWAG